MKDLTFVLCSRNDGYGGNSLWRLQTSVNFLAHHAAVLGVQDRLEILVSDWGSAEPLRTAVRLLPEAARVTRFVEVPVALARARQRDSVFAEVIANNAAIRRAEGTYVARIDQDTLVGPRFLSAFLDLAGKGAIDGVRLETAPMFVGRRSIPYSFAQTSPDFARVVALVDRCGRWLPREGAQQRPWFDAPVGAFILHRRLWEDYRGYDEALLYWGFMETDLALRVQAAAPVIDLHRIIGCDFYHLAHSPRLKRFTTRRTNPRVRPTAPRPNDDTWGLRDEPIALRSAPADTTPGASGTPGSVGPREVSAIAAEIVWQAGMAAVRSVRGVFLGDRVT